MRIGVQMLFMKMGAVEGCNQHLWTAKFNGVHWTLHLHLKHGLCHREHGNLCICWGHILSWNMVKFARSCMKYIYLRYNNKKAFRCNKDLVKNYLPQTNWSCSWGELFCIWSKCNRTSTWHTEEASCPT